MFGVVFGIISGICCAEFLDMSYWWTVAFVGVGIFMEICVRLGIGEPVCAMFDCLSCLGDIDFSGGGGD